MNFPYSPKKEMVIVVYWTVGFSLAKKVNFQCKFKRIYIDVYVIIINILYLIKYNYTEVLPNLNTPNNCFIYLRIK